MKYTEETKKLAEARRKRLVNLALFLMDRGFNYLEIGELTGYHQQTIKDYVAGKARPRLNERYHSAIEQMEELIGSNPHNGPRHDEEYQSQFRDMEAFEAGDPSPGAQFCEPDLHGIRVMTEEQARLLFPEDWRPSTWWPWATLAGSVVFGASLGVIGTVAAVWAAGGLS